MKAERVVSKAKPLNDELKRRFYPWVESKGFERQKITDPHVVEFRRQASEGEDVFDIQWDKYWRPYFVVNFSKEEPNGPGWPRCGRLQRRRGGSLSCWFGLAPPLLVRILQRRWRYEPREVIEELMAAFEELERWWRNEAVGPHMYILEHHA